MIICTECLNNFLDNPQINPRIYGSYEDLSDNGLYEITCPFEHVTSMPVQEQKFEILFDLGFYAIADGYYREAVSSFTSSLERFYEFYINATAYKNGVESLEFDKSWKKMSNQSERQLGAFIISYLIENKTSPILLDDKKINFRNNVIHKGKIPTRQEAIDYGKSVSELIFPTLSDLREKYLAEKNASENGCVSMAVSRYQNQISAENPEAFSGLVTIPTFLSLTRNIGKTFDEYLIGVEEKIRQIRNSSNKFWVVYTADGTQQFLPY